MNLLSLILIAMAVIVAGCVFYAAWQFSSVDFESDHARKSAQRMRGKFEAESSGNATGPVATKKEPGESKGSQDSPGP